MASDQDMNNALRDIGLHVKVRDEFKARCGDGARYHSSELAERDGHWAIVVCFEMVPEGRQFHLDGVVHAPGGDTEVSAAVARIADIAKNIRQHIAAEM